MKVIGLRSLTIAASLLLAAAGAAQDAPTYADILARYRAGEYEFAVRAVSSLPVHAMEDERRLLQRTPTGMARVEKLFPVAQASYAGVSEVLYVDGQPDRAATVIRTLLDRPAPRDPWWAYLMGEWWHYDARLTAMRNRVRQ
jgi:hypothetical protein